jgi:hypothetical protein
MLNLNTNRPLNLVLFPFQVNDLHREVQNLSRKLGSAAKECEDLNFAGENSQIDLKGKVLYSLDDPNR